MAVVAKFYVSALNKSYYPDQSEKPSESVTLNPCGGEDNKQWSKWTPSGSIQMTITNQAALEQFEIGKEFFVTFEPVPAKAPKTVGE